MDYNNILKSEYLERKLKLKNSFPAAYTFLESIENKTNEGFHIGTVKHLHLYYQNWLLFYFEFLSNTSVRIGKRNGSIKRNATSNYIYFFELLQKNISHSALKNYEEFEFNKKRDKYSLTINNSEECELIFGLIYKTLSEIEKSYKSEKMYSDLQNEFEVKIKQAKKLNDKKLQEKINKLGIIKPTKIITQYAAYNRSEYVTEFILRRANGKCEKCGQSAPFLRDSDNSPFLEVHHIVPLSENGDDTVENTIGLCPNCHKHAHFGKNTY
jgi:hypothetical protein